MGDLRATGARLGAIVLAALALVPATAVAADRASRPARIDGVAVPARATVAGVELSTGGGGFAPRFWPGINLGATIPGHDPGELARAFHRVAS